MKLTEQIEEQLELFETGTGSLNSIQGQVNKGNGWVVSAEGYESKTFDEDGDEDAFDEIKEFLGKALHKDHDGADFANDGERYLFKKSVIEKQFNKKGK